MWWRPFRVREWPLNPLTRRSTDLQMITRVEILRTREVLPARRLTRLRLSHYLSCLECGRTKEQSLAMCSDANITWVNKLGISGSSFSPDCSSISPYRSSSILTSFRPWRKYFLVKCAIGWSGGWGCAAETPSNLFRKSSHFLPYGKLVSGSPSQPISSKWLHNETSPEMPEVKFHESNLPLALSRNSDPEILR